MSGKSLKMVGDPGKPWILSNSSDKVFLKETREQPDEKMQHMMCICGLWNKTFWSLETVLEFCFWKSVERWLEGKSCKYPLAVFDVQTVCIWVTFLCFCLFKADHRTQTIRWKTETRGENASFTNPNIAAKWWDPLSCCCLLTPSFIVIELFVHCEFLYQFLLKPWKNRLLVCR